MRDRTRRMDAQHERVHAYFESEAATWEDRYSHDAAVRARIARFADALGRHGVEQGAVLDLGCGSGRITRSLARDGHSMTGSDISKQMLDLARCEPGGDRVTWVLQDAEQPFPLPLDADQFDAVVSSSVLEYMSDPKPALEEMVRLLKPGGWALFTVPDPRHAKRVRERRRQAILGFAPLRRLASLTPARSYFLYLELSVTRFTLGRWASLAAEAGLSVSPIGPCQDPLALIAARNPPTEG
jgi:ubiquinone/menaquinone biosynthesis C-methylase UbiE